MQGLLAEFWENREVVTRQNGFYGPYFRATCGTTQGGIEFPKLFNVAVNILARHWLLLAPEDESVIQYGLQHVVGLSLGCSEQMMVSWAHGTRSGYMEH